MKKECKDFRFPMWCPLKAISLFLVVNTVHLQLKETSYLPQIYNLKRHKGHKQTCFQARRQKGPMLDIHKNAN